jgi:uncharacterized protein
VSSVDPWPQSAGGGEEERVPRAEPVPVKPVRFCRECGEPWDPGWSECPRCAARRQLPQAATTYAHDRHSVRAAVMLYFAMLSVSIVLIACVLASGRRPSTVADIAATAAMSAMVLLFCIPRRHDLLPLLRQPFSPLWLPLAAMAAIPSFIAASLAVRGLVAIGGQKIDCIAPFLEDGYGYQWVVLLVCVQPAVIEELAFRGVIQSALSVPMGRIEAVVVTALMFAILHLSIPSLPHLAILGLALGWLRIKTGSLYPGMVMHFCHNLLVVLSERWEGVLPW